MQKFLNFALIFVITLLTFQLFAPKPSDTAASGEDLEIVAPAELTLGKPVQLTLTNHTDTPITLPARCPAAPVSTLYYQNGKWLPVESTAARCDPADLVLAPSTPQLLSLQPWQRTAFTQPGQYRVEIPIGEQVFQREIVISKSGFFGSLWREVFYRPIFNALVWLTELGGWNFGWGIVLLTLVIRIVLLVPFQKSLQAQRKMQKIQPEIDAIKKKYANNQQQQALETMALFKKHDVSPFGSCLPILLQMPFLLAVFWIVQGGFGENNFVLLYDFLHDFDPALVATNFFGLNLLKANLIWLPLAVGGLQFIQMKLAMLRTNKNKPSSEHPFADAMHNMTQLMPYFLPIMIAVFTATLPAAVGLYWGTSTLFGIGQQLVVNKQK